MRALVVLCAVGAAGLAGGCHARRELRVGSKKFTESVILGEIATQWLAAARLPAVHRRELGGTQLLWAALRSGEIDLYPEYAGTLEHDLFAGGAGRDLDAALAERGLARTRPLGFDDRYVLGMSEARAQALGIRTLSDLAAHPELRVGLSEEFRHRADGWPLLVARYGLSPRNVRVVDHDVAYRGLASGALDVIDLYSTDAEIVAGRLRPLDDDRGVLPHYRAMYLYRRDLARRAPGAIAALEQLAGRIDVEAMRALDAQAKLAHVPEPEVAAGFLARTFGGGGGGGAGAHPPFRPRRSGDGRLARIGTATAQHLVLVATSLAAAIVVAVPLGVLAARRRRLGQLVLAAAGVLQTIPSLALLVLMIPLFGIGALPAVVALFLYSLLPIVRNTTTGLQHLPREQRESAEVLGLTSWQRLRLVELPLASPAILSGIKTAAVIDVGMATLGAIIGAGGYGQPILSGIRLNDLGLIAEGAVPAALLALAVQALFDQLERRVVPRGLRAGT